MFRKTYVCEKYWLHSIHFRINVEQKTSFDRISQTNIPSVPSKKSVCINNGLQASSTSIITTEDDDDDDDDDDIFERKQIRKQTERKQFNPISCKQINYDSIRIINNSHLVASQHSPRSINEFFPIDSIRRPTLPSSKPPNIEQIKSSEILIKPSRSMKSISSMNIVKQKSNVSLYTSRSTIDFGFLIHDTTWYFL